MSRFSEPQDPAFRALNASIGFDRRLWPFDVAQSRAHARMLAARGIIEAADRDALLAGLDEVERELASERFPFAPDDELDLAPMADGGPGFVDVLHASLGGELLAVTVRYRSRTTLPVVGRLIPDPVLSARAVMRVEQ